MPPLLAHHAGEQVLAPLLLLGSSGVTLLLAIGRARLAAAHAKLALIRNRPGSSTPVSSSTVASATSVCSEPPPIRRSAAR